MSTKQEESPRAGHEEEARERRPLEAEVRTSVMRRLGQPAGLRRVQVRQLWDHNYRVNVFVGADAASARVAHSYFVAADGSGEVLDSTPAITRLY